jgi:hypothetical protein
VNGVLFVGTPVMFLMSIIYSIYLVGSPALVGSFAVFLFYPIMVSWGLTPFLGSHSNTHSLTVSQFIPFSFVA